MTPTWLMTKMFGRNWNETRLDGESPTENRRDSWIHWKGIRSKSQANLHWKDSRFHPDTDWVSRNGHPWNKGEKPKGIPTDKSNESILSGEEKLHYYSDAHRFKAESEEEAEIAFWPQQCISGLAGVRSSNKIFSCFQKFAQNRLPLFFDFESVNQPAIKTIRKILKIDSWI